jgi:hypothetical protein
MKFWLISIISGVILIGLALAFWLNQELLFSFNQESADDIAVTSDQHHHEKPVTSESLIDQAITVAKEKEKEITNPKKSSNAAADGLSRYYANLRGDMSGKGPTIRNNIVYLPDPEGNLEKILEARRLITSPLRRNWTGKTNSHPFRLGETLFQKLSEYAKNNGLEMIWWLNRDFVVKDAFRVNKNIITTSYQVGKAIEGHFENGLSIYFCYQQRAIVLIENDIPYLAKECMLLPNGKN